MSLTNSNQKNRPTSSFSPVITTGGTSASSMSSMSTSGTTTSSQLSLDHNTVSTSNVDNSVHREGDKTTTIIISGNTGNVHLHFYYGVQAVNDEEPPLDDAGVTTARDADGPADETQQPCGGAAAAKQPVSEQQKIVASSSLDEELKKIQLEKAKLECKHLALAVEEKKLALEERRLGVEQRKISLEREQVALANEKLINEALLRQAEATLCGQALRVHNCQTDEEPQKTPRIQSSCDGKTSPKLTKKNGCKRGSKPVDSSSRVPHKNNNKTQKSRLTDNSRGVVVDISIKVPHRSHPIQLSLECPKEETSCVRSGKESLAVEKSGKTVRDQSEEVLKSSHSEYFLDIYDKTQSLLLNERRQ